ncbi:MAG: hypothetical protein ACETWR_06175 [Anaerolineae bacterium]
MQAKWDDIVLLVMYSVSFGILWWLSAKLHNPHFGRFLWNSFFRARTFARQMWVFSAETVKAQEAEFVDERPFDFSAILPWLARALLCVLYFLVLLAWISLSTDSGNGG